MSFQLVVPRAEEIASTLHEGPMSLQTLSAITGLEGRVLSAIIDRMTEKNRVVRLTTGRLERFQLLAER